MDGLGLPVRDLCEPSNHPDQAHAHCNPSLYKCSSGQVLSSSIQPGIPLHTNSFLLEIPRPLVLRLIIRYYACMAEVSALTQQGMRALA